MPGTRGNNAAVGWVEGSSKSLIFQDSFCQHHPCPQPTIIASIKFKQPETSKIEILDVGGAVVAYSPTSAHSVSYINGDGTVNRSQLKSDILSGIGSPFPRWPSPINGVDLSFMNKSSLARLYESFIVDKYIDAYEDIHP